MWGAWFRIYKLTIGGVLYGQNNFHFRTEASLKYINLDNIFINSDIDSFTIDNFTIEELKEIKKLFLSLDKQSEIYNKEYNDLLENNDRDKDSIEKVKKNFNHWVWRD